MSDATNHPDQDNTGSSTKPKRSLARRVAKRVLMLGLLGSVVVVCVLIYMARSTPDYWKEHERFIQNTSPEQLEELAEEVEDKLDELANLGVEEAIKEAAEPNIQILTDPDAEEAPVETAAQVKPEDVKINVDKKIMLDNEQLAAVVKARMDEWMTDRGYVKPPEITDPMITIDDGKLIMAFRFQSGSFSQVISGNFDIEFLDDGMAILRMQRFLVGQLPVPADKIGEQLSKHSGGNQRAAKVGEWMEKLQELEFKPVIELENRRRARVQSFTLLEKGMEVVVRVQDHKTYKSMNKALAGVPTE